MTPILCDPPPRKTKWAKAIEFLEANPDKWVRLSRAPLGVYQWLPARDPRVTVTTRAGYVYAILSSSGVPVIPPGRVASHSQGVRAQRGGRKTRASNGGRSDPAT